METQSNCSHLFAEKLQKLRQWQKQQELRLLEQHKKHAEIIRQEQEEIRQMFCKNSFQLLKRDEVANKSTPSKKKHDSSCASSPSGEHRLLSSSTTPSDRLQRAEYLEKILREAVQNLNQETVVAISDKGLHSEENEDNHSNMEGICSLPDSASEDEDVDNIQSGLEKIETTSNDINFSENSRNANFCSDKSVKIGSKSVHRNERPISSSLGTKVKTFEDLIEIQIQNTVNDCVPNEEVDSNPKVRPKHKFLRKGQGLKRFQPGSVKKNSHSQVSQKNKAPTQSQVILQNVEDTKKDSFKNKTKTVKSPVVCKKNTTPIQKKLNVKNNVLPTSKNLHHEKYSSVKDNVLYCTEEALNVSSARKETLLTNDNGTSSLLDKKKDNKFEENGAETNNENKLNSQIANAKNETVKEFAHPIPIDGSFVLKIEELEKKRKKEQEELAEFEFLEKAAEETSFCSSSSIVVQALQKRLWNSPFKQPVTSTSSLPIISEAVNNNNQAVKISDRIIFPVKSGTIEDVSNSECNCIASPNTQFQHFPSSPISHFGKHLGEGDSGVSANHENINSDNDDEEKSIIDENFLSDIDFHDNKSWSEFDVSICDNGVCTPVPSPPSPGIPLASNLMASYFPTLKARIKGEENSGKKLNDCNSQSAEFHKSTEKMLEPIREKMVELEKALKHFQEEKNMLMELNNQHRVALRNLETEREAFLKQKSEEEKKMQDYFEEEKRKLRKEKRLCSESLRSKMQNGVSEREEIKKLRNEVEELQKLLKVRETKWLATQNRLKDRIQVLETENENIKTELQVIERQRLEKWKLAQQRECTTGSSKNPELSELEHSKREPRTKCITRKYTTIKGVENNEREEEIKQSPERDLPLSAGSSFISIDKEDDISSEDEISQDEFQIDPHLSLIDRSADILEETKHPDGSVERIYSDHAREIIYPNNTRKEIASDGHSVIVVFFNGDIKHVLPDRRIVYYFAENQTTNTTYPDGLQVYHFSNNQIEKHYPDGTKEIMFPDQSIKFLHPDGSEESILVDGTIIQINPSGDRIMQFPNGQREIHTEDFKKREYPDGTVKFLYPDGKQETHYFNGRVRIKNKDGVLLQDQILKV